MNKQRAKQKIKQLIVEYENLKRDNALKDKKEAFTKQRFIQPFFEALGWDFRIDVWPEESVSKDRVDYAFKIGDFTKFFVEAKKFSVDLEEEKWAEQAIDYAYNKSVTWAILTDFEGLKIFNSEWNKRPYRAVKEFSYKEYLTRFDEIWFLSKESIKKDELDKKAEGWGVKEKKIPVTEQLAQDLTEWRDGLKKEIDTWNKGKFPDEQIDEAVQRFLDRLIFIRYAEDKGLEPPTLEPILREYKKSGGDLIKKLNKVFRQFDTWYDSRLFEKHFSEDMEAYSGELEKIIEGLYRSKKSGHPYDFSAISSDVLGAVYEQYLGYLQKKETENNKKISKRKEQGIYYTPSFIVNYIVQNTLGTILKEKPKSEIKNIKILDPACGSGSFLIKAYQKLIDYYQKNINHKVDTKSKLGKIEKLMMDKRGVQELSVAQKLNILRENIYGVDLDPKAVEIAQLNLLLKAIAKRTKLPNLSHKIVCGNSLIAEGDEKFKPFNWQEEFKEVFEQGGFDVIIGNPPYIKEYTNKSAFDGLHDSPYYQGKMDIWTLFACIAIDLLKDGGYFSFIAPNNWLTNAGASIFRDKILLEGQITKFVDFGDFKVFKEAGIQTMIFIFRKGKPKKNYKISYAKITDKNIGEDAVNLLLQSNLKAGNGGITKFDATINPKQLTGKNIVFANQTNDEILNKIEAKNNFELTEKEVAQGIVFPQDFLNKSNQAKLGDNFIVGEGIFGLMSKEKENLHLTKEEKKLIKPYFTTEQLGRYYADQNNILWLIYTDSKFKNHNEMKSYPNIKAHLDRFKNVITSDNKPYGLHRARDEKFFVGEKIIVQRKCTIRPIFTYTDFDCYVSATFYVIKTERLNQKYLTGLLNSNLVKYWLKNKGKMQGSNFQIDKEPLLNLPLIKPDEKIQNEIALLVEKAIKLYQDFRTTSENTDKWHSLKVEIEKLERQIDEEVYKLYGLTEEDINVVNKNSEK